MEPKVDIWMPLGIGDYLADTSHLDTTQHGAYLLLLMHYWRKGPLPNDPMQLANIAKLSMDAWSMNQAVLMQFFTVAPDGLLHQKRSDREREIWMGKRVKAQDKASTAAKARWSRTRSNAPGNAPSTTQAMLGSCPLPSPLPIPLPAPEELPEGAKNAPSSGKEQGSVASEQWPEKTDEPPNETTREALPPLRQAAAVKEIFAYYLERVGRNPAVYTLSPLRMKKGLARLKEALRMAHGNLDGAIELMKAVVDEIALSDFHMGRNPKTEGKSYCDWENHLFRSTEQFESWLQKAQEGERRGTGNRE